MPITPSHSPLHSSLLAPGAANSPALADLGPQTKLAERLSNASNMNSGHDPYDLPLRQTSDKKTSLPGCQPEYKPKNNGLHALRDEGYPIKISGISPVSLSVRKTPCQEVKKFIGNRLSPNERRALYDLNLRVEKFTESDLAPVADNPGRLHCERYLVGQDKVVACRPLAPGTCIGVYAGELKKNLSNMTSNECNRSLQIGADQFILGDAIAAKLNSIYEFDPIAGYRQADTGYNLRKEPFEVETTSRQFPKTKILAFFTTREIQAGEELRWCYDVLPTQIKSALEGPPKGLRDALQAMKAVRREAIQDKIKRAM